MKQLMQDVFKRAPGDVAAAMRPDRDCVTVPEDSEFAGVSLRKVFHKRRRARSQFDTAALVMALRQQYQILYGRALRGQGWLEQIWLRYLWQVCAQPEALFGAMMDKAAVTFISPQDRRLEGFVPLRDTAMVTLWPRLHLTKRRQVINMLDLRILALKFDPGLGAVRTESWRASQFLSPPPFRSWGPPCAPVEDFATIHAGVAAHEAMEMAICGGLDFGEPVFPEIYVGFPSEDAVGVLDSPAIQGDLLQELGRWVLSERPTFWPALPELPQAARKLKEPPRSWLEVLEKVGSKDAQFLVEQMWATKLVPAKSMFLLPLRYVPPGQSELRASGGCFLHFTAETRGVPQVDEHGTVTVNDKLVRPVVIGAAARRKPAGTVGRWIYDLTATPPHLVKQFTPVAVRDALQ